MWEFAPLVAKNGIPLGFQKLVSLTVSKVEPLVTRSEATYTSFSFGGARGWHILL